MIAVKVATVDLVVELNLPLSTLVRINKVFKKSLRIQTLLKSQLKMFLFLVLISSFLCLLFFFSVIRGRHVWCVFLSAIYWSLLCLLLFFWFGKKKLISSLWMIFADWSALTFGFRIWIFTFRNKKKGHLGFMCSFLSISNIS